MGSGRLGASAGQPRARPSHRRATHNAPAAATLHRRASALSRRTQGDPMVGGGHRPIRWAEPGRCPPLLHLDEHLHEWAEAAGPCLPALLQGRLRPRTTSQSASTRPHRRPTALGREHHVGSQGRRRRSRGREWSTVPRRNQGRPGPAKGGGARGAGAAELGGADGAVDDGVEEGDLVEDLPRDAIRVSAGPTDSRR
jgi:hypothetical protein